MTVGRIPTGKAMLTVKAIRQKMIPIGTAMMGRGNRVIERGKKTEREKTKNGATAAVRQSETGIEHSIRGGRNLVTAPLIMSC